MLIHVGLVGSLVLDASLRINVPIFLHLKFIYIGVENNIVISKECS